jgi:hypothetical protein
MNKPQRFRLFVNNMYYKNKDEYDSIGLPQPYTFKQYVQNNLSMLKTMFRAFKKG